jgi:hypothetical protein
MAEQAPVQEVGKREKAGSGRYIGIALIAVGAAVVLAAVAVAFNAFYTYKVPVLVGGSSLDELISRLLNVLVELAVRLGFLGIAIWGGSILIKQG